uniref:Calmodulin binding transcription activator 1 n=1 Tax=Fundulus heteroclitus TaxID=8078 RepID=A0A3Q2QZH0_FUNHE
KSSKGREICKSIRFGAPSLIFFFCFALVADEHGHLKIYLPKKLLECLPKCTSLPKERHRWNTNEVRTPLLISPPSTKSISAQRCPSSRHAALRGHF